ncbi:hypothetical protein DPMN_179315 [Dreissena polymorpha]|uniref:NACHT domain-containing protein n=1 Tax=Dreissena polymorpha TaxID=45954 RepID=A0A9D4ECK2_DREPO|nr:hypothetical protein DPMN_179315 [Dreissena polymorpha]
MTMAATTNIFKDKETNNWFKACIALNVTKEGLTNFVEMTMKKVHAAIGSSCGQCTIEQLFPCSTQGLCNKRKRNSCSFHKSYLPQQCHICEQVKLGIISYHRFKGPSWKNTNAQGWKSNWWDIAKCYLPPQGYADMSSVQESDFNAVINIILNCTDFKNYLSPSWLSPPPPDPQCPLEKVRQIGRDVRHSANCKTTDAELQDYFQILTMLLADPVCLAHDTCANIALSRLTDLQNDRLPLTEFGNLIQEFKQAIERVKDAAEEEFSEKAKHTLEKGLNKIKEALKDSEQVIGKKMDENIQTLYDRTEYCKQQIGDQTSKAEHTIQTKTCVSITQIDTLTKSSVQLIEDRTRVNMERMQLKIVDKAEEDYERGLEDLLRRLIDHYRHSVICVPLSTLDTSLNKRIQDIYATPKIHKMKIEKDGKRVQQEQIHKYSDCFSGGLSRIYLQGEPGSGKSYFATKLVHDWCNVHAPIVKSTKEQKMFGDVDTLQKFRVLVFISLRDSREQTHVTRMIETQLIHKMYPEDEWESAYKLVLKILKNVMYLIIQDGLDEWPCIESLPVMDGIPKDQCIVLTTSRPWKLADKRISNLQIDILLGLEGISNPKEFNENILRCLLDESNDIKESVKLFEKFLRSHNLESISSSPMLNTLVLCTWVDDGAKRLTGSSLCELYTTMLDNMCIKANSQTGYFDRYHPLPVNCFSLTEYVKPNMEHIDAIAKAAFSFLFSNKKESSLVFSDIDLRAHLPETAKQFALDSGLLSERKGKKRTDQTVSFVHKTIQEFLTAFHIHMNADVIDGVISGYLKCHDNSYLDISQIFIFLCGFNISAANKLSTLMNELDFNSKFDDSFQNELDFSKFDDSFQNCILSGYREAVANKNTPIHLHLSHFKFGNSDDAKDLIQIWALNTSRARSLCVSIDNKPVTIRSQDASSSRCQGPGPVALPARKDHGVSTRDDEEQFRSSESGIEIALSSCHNLERLTLRCYVHFNTMHTLQPHALVGLKKLTHLEIDCKCEALDLSHCEHIQSINLNHKVTLLPLSLNNYKTLQRIEILTTYDGLDLSLFENLNSLTISNDVKVLPKPLLILNKLTHIELQGFDFNSVVHTWCLLNGANPVTCADYTPVLHSIEYICLIFKSELNDSTWLRSLLSTMLTLDHKVMCNLSLKVSFMENPKVDATIITDVNNTCTLTVQSDIPGLGETLHGLNVKHLRLHVHFVPHVPSLTYLSQLETLAVYSDSHKNIDLQLPPSLKYLTVFYDRLSPSELRHLMNNLSGCTQSLECRVEFSCVKFDRVNKKRVTNMIPPEEYIPTQQELDALEHVEVKQFRIYDKKPNTSYRSSGAWSVRDSVADDGDYVNNIIDNEFFKNIYTCHISDFLCGFCRISIGLQIN